MNNLHCIPPSPKVLAILYMEYLRSRKKKKMLFQEYLKHIGFTNPADGVVGMDDAKKFACGPKGMELIKIPSRPVTGKLQVKVLLVDFSDREGSLPPQHYEDMLFSSGLYPTGSMRDYYSEASSGKVDVMGKVHGWLRMPERYSYYTNNESGMGAGSYPRNAQRLAEDAVNVALKEGIKFDSSLDKLKQGIVTALFIIHAGRGAEQMYPALRNSEIWSHKWSLRKPVQVGANLYATIYLVVPQDCAVGVCAHELGHLAFQWQDFYDPNYDRDGKEWDGSGVWDLMAGGSWNADGTRPAHPAGLHKLQHGWVEVDTVNESGRVVLKPYDGKSGKVCRVVSPRYKEKQYLLLENRRKAGFDFDLPGEGLLVWRVDESMEMEAPDRPGMLLIQADGKHSLEVPKDWNQGDAGDPFPGSMHRVKLSDSGSISTSFPDGKRSGVALDNISIDPDSGDIKLDVKFKM